jgi:hypothetical protein
MKIEEFQSIMPIRNVPSVLEHGILSHERMAKLPHASVAMQEVQERRDQVRIPGGLMLHQYANLYFHARNPMMFKRKEEAGILTVLRISTEAWHIPGAVIADQNAATDWVRFLSIEQAVLLDLEAIYARDWRHPNDPIAYRRHRAKKCAEFLVPHCLPAHFITGAYVVNEQAELELAGLGFTLPIEIDADLFFHCP